MRSGSIVSGRCIAVIVTTLCATNAFAGFSDRGEAKTTSTMSVAPQNAIASIDDDATPDLKFDTKGEDKSASGQTQTQTVATPEGREFEQPVAAPLPVAPLPGGMLLAGSFFATKILKKRIV